MKTILNYDEFVNENYDNNVDEGLKHWLAGGAVVLSSIFGPVSTWAQQIQDKQNNNDIETKTQTKTDSYQMINQSMNVINNILSILSNQTEVTVDNKSVNVDNLKISIDDVDGNEWITLTPGKKFVIQIQNTKDGYNFFIGDQTTKSIAQFYPDKKIEKQLIKTVKSVYGKYIK